MPAGAAVAVVGRSGAGKSLLAAIAGRLVDPDEGVVLLDGVPMGELDRAALRRAVGYAFERPVLVGDTLADAIGFGAVVSSPHRIREAARAAHADLFIGRLPEGYGTLLNVAPMSGGEAQRVGLARAFAHGERLLILDDATSSLDTATELQVSRALTKEFGDRTRMIVAHRVATASRSDLVAWIDEGGIRAYGPHHELWEDLAYRAIFHPAEVRCRTPPVERGNEPEGCGGGWTAEREGTRNRGRGDEHDTRAAVRASPPSSRADTARRLVRGRGDPGLRVGSRPGARGRRRVPWR